MRPPEDAVAHLVEDRKKRFDRITSSRWTGSLDQLRS